jgi:glycosyltransferase involved in cell wall biosynthesis
MPLPERSRRPSVTFLVFDAYSGGGVSRTTANLANHLARTRDVRVINLYKWRRRRARFALDPAVELITLRDPAQPLPGWARALDARPSRLRPAPTGANMTLLTDLLLRRALRAVPAGSVVISTRPSLHLAATAYVRRGVKTIGWEHLNFSSRMKLPRMRALLEGAVPDLDGYVVLTQADASDYRRALPLGKTEVEVIRNSVAWPVPGERPARDSKTVVAAGRLIAHKGFKRLIRAYAPIARSHPDWQLHIYGEGPLKRELKALVARLGLEHQVRIQGYTRDLHAVLAQASVFAMASRKEGFPMVLIEAMSNGVPLIAFDCPRGPAEIIRHGENGLLIPEGPIRRYTRALRGLVEDAELRERLGAQALRDADEYTIEHIAAQWEGLFARLGAPREDGKRLPTVAG